MGKYTDANGIPMERIESAHDDQTDHEQKSCISHRREIINNLIKAATLLDGEAYKAISAAIDYLRITEPMSLKLARAIVEGLQYEYVVEPGELDAAWNLDGYFNADQLIAIARVMKETK